MTSRMKHTRLVLTKEAQQTRVKLTNRLSFYNSADLIFANASYL